MEDYFVVLELPGGKTSRFVDGNTEKNAFWGEAAYAVKKGKAKIISSRKDTGVSEELRDHSKKTNKFSTYILFNMQLATTSRKEIIFQQAAASIAAHTTSAVIEANDDFQLLAIAG